MSTIGGPEIITDGLYFSIDPANHKSYPGSGTAVSDLVARNTSPVLTNGAGYNSINGGVFSFDGVDDFLLVSNNGQTSGFDVAEFTVELWVYLNPATAETNATLWSFDFTSHTIPYYAQHLRYIEAINGNRRYYHAFNNNGSWGASASSIGSSNGTAAANEWQHVLVTAKNGSQKIYTNGTAIASNTDTYTSIQYYAQEVWIGRANYSTGYFGGYIGPVNFYKRFFEQSDVTHNFNVHRNRFGI